MRTWMTMCTAAALLAAGPALAQMNQGQQQQPQTQQQQQQQQQQTQRVQGELVDLREVQLQGEQEPHVLAKVRMQDGQTVVIDLGTPSELRQQAVRLRQGQQIRATGRQGRINNLPILVVDRYVGDGEFTIIAPIPQQAWQQQMQPQRQARQQQLRQQQFRQRRGQQTQQTFGFAQQAGQQRQAILISGQLTELRDVQLNGLSDKHRLAKIQTEQGQTVVIDLGTQDQLQDVQLKQGETIAVLGSAGRINGKPVIFAQQLADIVRIDRSREQQQKQQQQNQQQNQQKDQQNQQKKDQQQQ